MVERKDVNRLLNAQNEAARLAVRDLKKLWSRLDVSNPAQVRDALLELVPALVNRYGDVAAAAAADWYEKVRAEVPGLPPFTTLLADPIPEEHIQTTIRRQAGGLWEDKPNQVLNAVGGEISRWVKQSAKDTIAKNIKRDPAKPGWARVPKGASTCAWCSMLASRGFAYTGEPEAEAASHRNCDCQIVPSFGKTHPKIEGYDPERLYDEYSQARDAVDADGGDPSDKEQILKAMRKLFPDRYSDGVKPKKPRNASHDGTLQLSAVGDIARKARLDLDARGLVEDKTHRLAPEEIVELPVEWPAGLPRLRANAWYHTLYGDRKSGGHLYGYGWRFGSDEFPEDWTPEDIARAGIEVLSSRQLPETNLGTVVGNVRGISVRVAYRNDSKGRIVKSIHPYTRSM
ncbi:VG15 protein [Actinomyces culturomici]|uniref:VG15 protein n=1 Tax=Actinomyces culturomici TaxID=1926276 RepID=UPI000E2041E2|nr:EndoU domain-containing protein [Actinomyces culturomici]